MTIRTDTEVDVSNIGGECQDHKRNYKHIYRISSQHTIAVSAVPKPRNKVINADRQTNAQYVVSKAMDRDRRSQYYE